MANPFHNRIRGQPGRDAALCFRAGSYPLPSRVVKREITGGKAGVDAGAMVGQCVVGVGTCGRGPKREAPEWLEPGAGRWVVEMVVMV